VIGNLGELVLAPTATIPGNPPGVRSGSQTESHAAPDHADLPGEPPEEIVPAAAGETDPELNTVADGPPTVEGPATEVDDPLDTLTGATSDELLLDPLAEETGDLIADPSEGAEQTPLAGAEDASPNEPTAAAPNENEATSAEPDTPPESEPAAAVTSADEITPEPVAAPQPTGSSGNIFMLNMPKNEPAPAAVAEEPPAGASDEPPAATPDEPPAAVPDTPPAAESPHETSDPADEPRDETAASVDGPRDETEVPASSADEEPAAADPSGEPPQPEPVGSASGANIFVLNKPKT
jgi:hypothetical protein